MIQFGNKISFAENKSRRTWKPNVQVKSMFSETLQRMLRFRMTTHAMRCVRKAGGIDEYLLKAKDSEIKFDKALRIREEIRAVRANARKTGELFATDSAGVAAASANPSSLSSSVSSPHKLNDRSGGATQPIRASGAAERRPCGLQLLLWL